MRAKGEFSDPHTDAERPEFSRVVHVTDLSVAQKSLAFEASPGELAALTQRLGLEALESLAIGAELHLIANGDVLAKFTYTAQIEQRCGITLQPIKSTISTEFTTTFSVDADSDWGHDEEQFEDLEADIEPPEPLVNGTIDIGEACVEHLALEIDPFPRVQGATFEGYSTDSIGTAQGEIAEVSPKKNPFTVLSKLKPPKENNE
jgi:uncharacterized metal-binding protein YceD (DUF177 family)